MTARGDKGIAQLLSQLSGHENAPLRVDIVLVTAIKHPRTFFSVGIPPRLVQLWKSGGTFRGTGEKCLPRWKTRWKVLKPTTLHHLALLFTHLNHIIKGVRGNCKGLMCFFRGHFVSAYKKNFPETVNFSLLLSDLWFSTFSQGKPPGGKVLHNAPPSCEKPAGESCNAIRRLVFSRTD